MGLFQFISVDPDYHGNKEDSIPALVVTLLKKTEILMVKKKNFTTS